MHLEKIRLDKIQNGRLSAIIHFHMAVIWSTVLDGYRPSDLKIGGE